MEPMKRAWLLSLWSVAVVSLLYAQRPNIAWIGGGEIGTYGGFYFLNEQYFVTNIGWGLHFWRLSDNRLVRTLTLVQLAGRYFSDGNIAPMPNRQQLVVAFPDTDASTGFRGIRIRILQPSDPSLINWSVVAQGGSFVNDGDPEDEPGNAGALAVSPDGQYIVVGGGDGVFRRHGLVLYRVQGTTIQRVQYLTRNPDWAPIFSAAFSPDGEWLFAGSTGGWVFVYKRQPDGSYAYRQRFTIGGNGYYILCFSFAYRQDGKYVAVGVLPNGIIEIRRYSPVFDEWRIYMQWQTPNMSAPTSSVNGLQFSPDGNYLAVAYGTSAFGAIFYDPYLRIYQIQYSSDPDYRAAVPILQEEFPYDVVTTVAYNASGRELFSGTRNGNLRRWNTETLTSVPIPNHRGFPSALAWSPDGSKIATSADANYSVPTQTFIWDFNSQSVWVRINHLTASWIGAVAFSPDGNYVATVGRDLQAEGRPIELWDVNTGAWVTLVGFLDYNGSGLAFSPDGQYLYAAARNGDLRAFQRDASWLNWVQIAQVNAPDNALSPVQIALSPNG
ncbi:MAG: WD40 repeat domain-containing protein, partial [Fimbriimonadales bacterium]|nr:WD40 repeat domain-containing protein [Fimbriimonadales bacterium]